MEYQRAADEDCYQWYYTVKLTETGGAATTIGAFSIDTYDLSDYIAARFGSTTLPANGSVSIDLRSKNQEVPSDHVFAFAGVDASGQKGGKQITIPFRGPKPANTVAAMSLTSDPAVVVKTGKGDPDCAPDHPYGQTLNLKELNGVAVKLTKIRGRGERLLGPDRGLVRVGHPTCFGSAEGEALLATYVGTGDAEL